MTVSGDFNSTTQYTTDVAKPPTKICTVYNNKVNVQELLQNCSKQQLHFLEWEASTNCNNPLFQSGAINPKYISQALSSVHDDCKLANELKNR